MQNLPERNESEIRIIHNSKFNFSIFEGGRYLSWCDLKVLQGKNNKTLVILSQPQGYIGISIGIASAVKHIATHITNRLGLVPDRTKFIHYKPPTVDKWPEAITHDDPMAELIRHSLGSSDEEFDQATFQWVEAETDQSILERYSIQGEPNWFPIPPGEVANC